LGAPVARCSKPVSLPGQSRPHWYWIIWSAKPAERREPWNNGKLVAHEPLPAASRILFIRVPDTPKLNATNRYFDAAPGAIAADLVGLGLEPLVAASPVDFADVCARDLADFIQQSLRAASSSI
jgi:hypothetical protein